MLKHKSRTSLGVTLLLVASLQAAGAAAQQPVPRCAPDNAGITLPEGFCALVVADGVGRARHLTVAPNGDVFVAIGATRGSAGGVLALRDTTGDGVADVQVRFGSGAGDDVEFRGGYLYYSTNNAVVRYPWRVGSLEPAGPADTIARDLPATRGHRAKSIAFGSGGALYVNVGSPSNACQQQSRTAGSAGKDPCDELETRAGIWRFDADRTDQRQRDGRRFATGLRNTVALAARPQDGKLYGVVHGRDQLSGLWPRYFTDDQSAEKPSEEFVRIEEGDDFGWPYCYHDPERGQKVLAPEYGGDGETLGRCSEKKDPLIGFPAHWAPNGLHFYSGTQFPARYRGGAFIAFHGSWNRAPLPQAGYNIVFAPFDGGEPTGEWDVFADGFAGENVSPRGAAHRPVGVAEGPDGSLYVGDDRNGRIYRVVYRGGTR
ncbi:MAG: sorbosone dehydrogenase [Gemmatimonadales bacterium]|nr:sorbosone dehydrogenase [Gemmatimonadales bacterium]NIN12294.1 sorbosone dehydrogenase [Gemmatimonadales bacterium]NIN50755.1 sorbosone dehydrogenase [Gemmatimonadales bacterium]NIP08219.1 sorbosone dehydrogenase [Gemmatimonadales bacterium]NIQ99383.1 sorbosone dehydrogenase [Gemmatimonadales bacterium]